MYLSLLQPHYYTFMLYLLAEWEIKRYMERKKERERIWTKKRELPELLYSKKVKSGTIGLASGRLCEGNSNHTWWLTSHLPRGSWWLHYTPLNPTILHLEPKNICIPSWKRRYPPVLINCTDFCPRNPEAVIKALPAPTYLLSFLKLGAFLKPARFITVKKIRCPGNASSESFRMEIKEFLETSTLISIATSRNPTFFSELTLHVLL